MAHDVFISYTSQDKTAADAVVNALESKGIRCWYLPRDISPGLSWGETIVNAIEESKAFILILSKHATESQQIIREVELSVSKGLIIIPFRIEDISIFGPLAYFLVTSHWLDAFDSPIENHLPNLINSVARILNFETEKHSNDPESIRDSDNAMQKENNKVDFRKRFSNIFSRSPKDETKREEIVQQKDESEKEGHLKIVDSIEIQSGSSKGVIQFCVGDLSNTGINDRVDVLVVSAFRDYYVPIPGSLIGSIYDKGLSVEELARDKEVDLRQAFSCWLSKEIPNPPKGIQFKRILCYEPSETAKSAELVGDIFRSLAPFLGGQFPIRTVATPLITSGFQQGSKEEILHQLVDSAVHWISSGLPLTCLKIVCLPDENVPELISQFSDLKKRYIDKTMPARNSYKYDLFISYSHNDTREVKIFEQMLLEKNQDLKLFIDRKNLTTGAAWQREIFEAIDDCAKVATFYSPTYLDSKVCVEEFNIALCRHRESESEILKPIYLYSATLPTYMRLIQFYDCREFNQRNLDHAASKLLESIHQKVD